MTFNAKSYMEMVGKIRFFVTVRALIFNSEGKLLIVRRGASDPLYAGAWDIPGGRVEAGEEIFAALRREANEEVGIKLQNPELVFATSSARPGGSGTWIFFIERCASDPQIKLGDEHDTYQWINFADLPVFNDYKILTRMHTYLTHLTQTIES
jgi:8-oxo-dGTP diphosphatase